VFQLWARTGGLVRLVSDPFRGGLDLQFRTTGECELKVGQKHGILLGSCDY
jgi:hypothetical protein